MELKVLKYPDPSLRLVSKPIELINNKLSTHNHTIAYDLTDTLILLKDRAIGLGAPQIGHNLRIIAINVYKPYTMINPEIIKASEFLTPLAEGCLSFEPTQRIIVSRSKRIEVKFIDIQGRQQRLNFDGLEAKAIQHEIDHLDGILMIDKEIK